MLKPFNSSKNCCGKTVPEQLHASCWGCLDVREMILQGKKLRSSWSFTSHLRRSIPLEDCLRSGDRPRFNEVAVTSARIFGSL
jgi:hypothetical protein